MHGYLASKLNQAIKINILTLKSEEYFSEELKQR